MLLDQKTKSADNRAAHNWFGTYTPKSLLPCTWPHDCLLCEGIHEILGTTVLFGSMPIGKDVQWCHHSSKVVYGIRGKQYFIDIYCFISGIEIARFLPIIPLLSYLLFP